MIGVMDKLQAHIEGCLHEAFSVFIFNDKQQLLLQQRAHSKYHGGGLWSNSCCSHPQPSDQRPLELIASERLQFEMGVKCSPLHKVHTVCYRVEMSNGLIEHEYDHILFGYSATEIEPQFNPDEVMAWRWQSIEELRQAMQQHPEKYTPWFHILMKQTIKFAYC